MMGPNFQKPEPEVMDGFRYDSIKNDSTLNLAWWDLIEDPVLDTLIAKALRNNKNALIAASRIEEARSYWRISKADMLPSTSYQATAGRSNFEYVPNATSNYFSIAPVLNWEIDFWGKYRRATEAAKAELIANEYAREWILTNLISDVASTYFTLLDFDNRLAISESTLKSRQVSLEIIAKRFEHGTVPEIDLNQAQIQLAIAQTAVPSYERAVGITENTLSILIGENPRSIERGSLLYEQFDTLNIPVGLPSELLLRRPDILQAENRLKAQNARIGVAQANRFPSFSLTGIAGLASLDLADLASSDALIWSASAGITGPIFNFGKLKRRVEIEKYRTEQARLQYEQTVQLAFADVEDALLGLRTYNREANSRIFQMEAARNANNLSRQRYDGGVTSYLEVLDSERSLFNAELAASEAMRNKLSSYIFLYKALGGGWMVSKPVENTEND